MKQTLPVIHCIYTEAEKRLEELLEESFRLYLVRAVHGETYVSGNKQSGGLPCRTIHPIIKGG